MKTRTQSQSGLSLMEVVIVLATIVLLFFLFIPRLTRSHVRISRLGCDNYLKQVGLAFRLFSNDHGDKFPFAVPTSDGGTLEFTNSPLVFRHFQAMSNELVTPKILVCSMDTNRQKASDFLLSGTSSSFNSSTNLSYFAALDADESKPERLLSGDRNMTGGTLSNGFLRLLQPTTKAGWTSEMHNNAGNVGLSDGSVMQTDARLLRQQLRTNTLSVIRLAIP